MNDINDINDINQLVNDLYKCLKAHQLLEDIWLEVGPYDNTYSDSIRYKLQDYFGFNDDE